MGEILNILRNVHNRLLWMFDDFPMERKFDCKCERNVFVDWNAAENKGCNILPRRFPQVGQRALLCEKDRRLLSEMKRVRAGSETKNCGKWDKWDVARWELESGNDRTWVFGILTNWWKPLHDEMRVVPVIHWILYRFLSLLNTHVLLTDDNCGLLFIRS